MDHEWGHGPMAPASPIPAQYLVPSNKSCAHRLATIRAPAMGGSKGGVRISCTLWEVGITNSR